MFALVTSLTNNHHKLLYPAKNEHQLCLFQLLKTIQYSSAARTTQQPKNLLSVLFRKGKWKPALYSKSHESQGMVCTN